MKKLDKRVLWSGLILVLCVVVLCLLYYYPVQRVLAEKKLDEYMTLQGVDVTEIESIAYHKDYKQDGYSVFVNFRNDEYQYVYRYYLFSSGPGHGIRYHTMYCDVYNHQNRRMDEFVEGMKYKSLEWTESPSGLVCSTGLVRHVSERFHHTGRRTHPANG